MDRQVVTVLLVASGVLLAGVLSTKLASRAGVPALVLFLLVGMVLGSDITGLIYFDDAWLAQLVGMAALAVILFEGGLHTDWRRLRSVAAPAVLLATVGVAITMAVTGVLVRAVMGTGLPLALLVGAIVGSTDAAAVFSVLGDLHLRPRLRDTLEAESGLNDPMAVFLTGLTLSWLEAGRPALLAALGGLIWQMGCGLMAGVAAGYATRWILTRMHLEAGGLYPVLLLAAALFVFAFTSPVNASGFVAVYVYGVVLGSGELPYRHSILRFHEGAAWLAQIGMFILLGLLVFPRQLVPVVPAGLAIAAGLMFLARPLAVWLSTLGQGFTLRERLFLSWAGLRGAVPIVLATLPMLAGVPQSNLIFNVVFFVVLTSALVQGATVGPLARWLGLLAGPVPSRAVSLELVGAGRLNVDLIEVLVPAGAAAVGKRLAELHLPEEATVSALVRKGRVLTPRGGTLLEAGDVLFILTDKEASPRVRAVFAPLAD